MLKIYLKIVYKTVKTQKKFNRLSKHRIDKGKNFYLYYLIYIKDLAHLKH